jgi:hypothetical protein
MTGLTDKDDADRNDRYTLSLQIQMFGDIRQDLLQKALESVKNYVLDEPENVRTSS